MFGAVGFNEASQNLEVKQKITVNSVNPEVAIFRVILAKMSEFTSDFRSM